MPKVKVGKPPAGLKDSDLHDWYVDAFEDAYEKTLFEQRQARREAETARDAAVAEVETLKGQVPGEDTVLLTGDNVARWNELQEANIDELRAKALAGDRIVRQTFLREVAEASGFNPKTFSELVELRNLSVTKVEEDGKVSYAVEVEKDGKKQAEPIVDHFQTVYADWLPALAPTDGTPPTRLGPPPPPPTGRLQSAPRRKPDDAQSAYLAKVKAEAEKSKNVVLQGLQGPGGNK